MKTMLMSSLEIGLLIACIILAILLFVVLFFVVGGVASSLIVKRNNPLGRGIGRKNKRLAKRLKIDYKWWNKFDEEYALIKSFDNLTLSARLIRQSTNKIAIVCHGFMNEYQEMQSYCKYFYDRGFTVLAVDNRAHGRSEGEIVGMGWLDRFDILKWIEYCISNFGDDCQIVLFGLSMGAATVCMTCGEELPENVKCAISDSAYDSVYNVFDHVMKKSIKLSLIKSVNAYSKLFLGASLKEQDTVKLVKNSKTPILFIHGSGDDFVPFEMMDKLYNSVDEKLREKYVVENAWHGEAKAKNVKKYNYVCDKWISKFVK